jgi:hypothetical protein
MTGSCEHGSLNGMEFLDYLDYKILKKGSTPWSWYALLIMKIMFLLTQSNATL